MKQLNSVQSAIFVVGALLMVIGAVSSVFHWSAAFYVYAVGAVAFTSMQMLQSYDGNNFVLRRLRRIVIVSDLLFLLTAVLMFAGQGNALGLDWLTYVNYVQNNWVVTLLVAAILQLYTSHRIGSELEKEAKKR
ncbi:MAG: hypothetical protein J6Z14_03685 [Prevotella sp.]|nr:hypothetical protein [Prevotella sp.]